MHVPCNLPLRLSWAEGGVKESGASCALSCRCADAHSVMVLLSACSLEGEAEKLSVGRPVQGNVYGDQLHSTYQKLGACIYLVYPAVK